jgi:hypothetical protein
MNTDELVVKLVELLKYNFEVFEACDSDGEMKARDAFQACDIMFAKGVDDTDAMEFLCSKYGVTEDKAHEIVYSVYAVCTHYSDLRTELRAKKLSLLEQARHGSDLGMDRYAALMELKRVTPL